MINQEAILKAAESLVYNKLSTDSSGHDWWHIVRVRRLARTIAEKEGADVFICQLTALLHDMADDKLNADPAVAMKELEEWLAQTGLAPSDQAHVLSIIQNMSFSKGKKLPSLEGQVVQDADRLDAIGAIGIARTMAYSGSRGRTIHDPNRLPRENLTAADYRNGQDTAIMHFYEKLLKLKDLMNTQTAKELAAPRHAFLETFLQEFMSEWHN